MYYHWEIIRTTGCFKEAIGYCTVFLNLRFPSGRCSAEEYEAFLNNLCPRLLRVLEDQVLQAIPQDSQDKKMKLQRLCCCLSESVFEQLSDKTKVKYIVIYWSISKNKPENEF